jgi:hypothetical protein
LARFAATVRGETDLKKQRKDAKTQRKSYDRLRLSVLAFSVVLQVVDHSVNTVLNQSVAEVDTKASLRRQP